MQYLVSKDNFTKITEPKGTLQNISRTLTIEVSNTQTENSGVLLPPMSKIQFDGNSVYVRCVDGAGAEARVIPFEVVVKGGDGGGTDFSLDQAGTTIVEDFKFSALEYPNATNPNLDGKTVLVMSVKDANETTQLVKYVFVDLAKLIGASTNLKPSDNAIGISGASIGLNLSASAGNILSVAGDGLYAWLGVAGGVSGNFAILGESGAIVDGGFSLADIAGLSAGEVFTGATSITGGLSGLVPAPVAGDESKFLRGNGTWSDELILPTVASAVDGSLWFDLVQNTPLLRYLCNGVTFSFEGAARSVIYFGRITHFQGLIDANDDEWSENIHLVENGVRPERNPTNPALHEATISQAQMQYSYSQPWQPNPTDNKDFTFNGIYIDIYVKEPTLPVVPRIIVDGEAPTLLLSDPYTPTGITFEGELSSSDVYRLRISTAFDAMTASGNETAILTINVKPPAPYEEKTLTITFTGLASKQAIHWEGRPD